MGEKKKCLGKSGNVRLHFGYTYVCYLTSETDPYLICQELCKTEVKMRKKAMLSYAKGLFLTSVSGQILLIGPRTFVPLIGMLLMVLAEHKQSFSET